MDWEAELYDGETENKDVGGECQESAGLTISKVTGISVASDLRWKGKEMSVLLFVSEYSMNLGPVVGELFPLCIAPEGRHFLQKIP